MLTRRAASRATKSALVTAAFVLVEAEGETWAACARIGAALARVALWRAVERLVAAVDATLAVALFLLPMAALFPVKLSALWLLGTGHPLAGIALAAAAKVAETAASARLYAVVEPRLMTVPLFARARAAALGLHARATAFLSASPAWHAAIGRLALARAALRHAASSARAGSALRGGPAGRLAASLRLACRGS